MKVIDYIKENWLLVRIYVVALIVLIFLIHEYMMCRFDFVDEK